MSIACDFERKAMGLEEDRIFCIGFPREVYNLTDPVAAERVPLGGNSEKIETSQQFAKFVATQNHFPQRIIIDPQGKIKTCPGNSNSSHYELGDQVLTGGVFCCISVRG